MANLSNINNNFIVTDGGQALVNQTVAGFNPDADDLIVGNLSGNTGITIASGSSAGNYGSIYFADGAGSSTASKAGYIRYEQNTSKMTIGINAVEKVAIDIGGNTTFAGNIRTGTSTLTANTNFDNLVIEGSAHTGITIFSGTSSDGGIYFGDSGANNLGQIKYLHGSNAMTFATNDGAASLTLDSSQNSTFAGDVNISSPGDLYINSGTSYNNKGSIFMSNQRTEIVSDIVNLTANGDTSLNFKTRSGGATASALFIDEFRNVGIGTPSPDAKLHIYGSASLSEMYLGEDAAADKAGILKYTQGDGSGTGVVTLSHWGNNSNTQSLAIKYGGNVGIGTTSPSEILHLNAPGTGCFIRFQNTGGSGVYIGGRSEVMEMYTNGSEKMRITSTGNVGIGTTTPAAPLAVQANFAANGSYTTSGWAKYIFLDAENTGGGGIIWTKQSNTYNRAILNNQGKMEFGRSTANDNSGAWLSDLAIDATGNVGIGTDSPNLSSNGTYGVRVLTVGGNVAGYPGVLELAMLGYAGTGGNMGQIQFVNGTSRNASISSHPETNVLDNAFLDFNTKQTGVALALRMRITSVGHILFNTTSTSLTSGLGFKFINDGAAPYMGIVANSSSATGNTNYHYYNMNAAYNGFRFYIANNGGIYNFAANNVNLSDERVKHNIENSGNYLDKICSIPVRLFNYKDEPEGTDKNLGVIAQEVEAVAPELVNNDGFGETPEDGIELKTVYSTDMMYALMKAIQELKADNDILKSKIETLENK